MSNSSQVTLEMRKLYVGDMSIEVPHAPEIFQEELDPEINLGLNHDIKSLTEDNLYAVRLRLTVTAKDTKSDRVIYLVEVVQSGVFEISGLSPEQHQHALNVYIPTTLYPYAREVISSSIIRAGFPALYLQPINFEALYQHQLQEKQANTNKDA